jgi:hypothetical protein
MVALADMSIEPFRTFRTSFQHSSVPLFSPKEKAREGPQIKLGSSLRRPEGFASQFEDRTQPEQFP